MNPPTSTPASSAAPAQPTQWFMEEVYPHDRQLRAYLLGSFPTVPDVEDVVQESYLRVWKVRAARPILSAKGLLFRVARNLALDLVRRNRTSPLQQVGDFDARKVVDEFTDVSASVSANEKTALLIAALEKLPVRCRQVVILCKLQGHSYRDVALQLNLSEKTVAEHLYRGVQRLGEELQRQGVQRLSR